MTKEKLAELRAKICNPAIDPWEMHNATEECLDEIERLRAAIDRHKQSTLTDPATQVDLKLWEALK